jgi:hypothetical protein
VPVGGEEEEEGGGGGVLNRLPFFLRPVLARLGRVEGRAGSWEVPWC